MVSDRLTWAVVNMRGVVYVSYGHNTTSLRDKTTLMEMQEDKLEHQLEQPAAIL